MGLITARAEPLPYVYAFMFVGLIAARAEPLPYMRICGGDFSGMSRALALRAYLWLWVYSPTHLQFFYCATNKLPVFIAPDSTHQ